MASSKYAAIETPIQISCYCVNDIGSPVETKNRHASIGRQQERHLARRTGRAAAWPALLLALSTWTGCLAHGEPAGPYHGWKSHNVREDAGREEPTEDASSQDEDPDEPAADGGAPVAEEVPPCLKERIEAVQARLDVCRTCHRPKGLAQDSKFVLDRDRTLDAARLRAAYRALGDELLHVPAEDGNREHPGGERLVPGTATYEAWEELLDALGDPQCGAASP